MNSLFPLESVSAAWLSQGFTACAVDVALSLVCGVGLYLLLLPFLPGDQSSPPPGKKKTIRKCQMQMKGRSKSNQNSRALKACRDGLEYLDETQSMASFMQRLLGMPPDKESSHQPLHQDPPDEACRRGPAGAHQPHGERAASASIATPLLTSPSPQTSSLSPGPATSSAPSGSISSLPASQPPEPLLPQEPLLPRPQTHSLPPACPPKPMACPRPPTSFSEPLPDWTPDLPQWDSTVPPPGRAITRSSFLRKRLPSSPTPATQGSPMSAVPWWQVSTKAWSPATSAEGKSRSERLSCHPPEASAPGDLGSRQMAAGDPSSLGSEGQKLLGTKVTNKVEIQVWKEKENIGSFLEQTDPGNPFSSSTSVLHSLGAGEDTTSPKHFGDMKDKSEQSLGPQQLCHPKVLEDHFQQKYIQLFWGLPSLHSESLVAAAWISQSSALLPSFFFNKTSSVGPDQRQDKKSPRLPQAQPLSLLEPHSPPLILSVPQFQPQALGPFHLQSSLQTQIPSSPPHITDSGASQNKPQSLVPTEIQPPEMPLFGKQIGTGWSLPSVAQRPQEVYSVLTPNLSKDDWAASILPDHLPMNPELRRQLEQHIQKWLVQHRRDLPRRIQELMQLQDKLARMCQTKDRPCPERLCLSTGGSSQNVQMVRFQPRRDSGRNLGHILGKVPKHPPRALEVFPVKVPEENSVEPERTLLRQSSSESRDDISTNRNEDLENILKVHLGLKSAQISKGLIPLSVRRSWLYVNNFLSPSNTQRQTIHLASSQSWETCISTCWKIPFLDPCTQQTLEEHITRFWVKHRWSLPLKILRPVNVFKLKKSASSSLLQLTRPPSATCASGPSSATEIATFPDKTSQACLREKAIADEAVGTLASSPAGKEIRGALMGIPSDLGQGPSAGAGWKSRQPAQTLPCSLKDTTCQSTTVSEAERGSLKVHVLPRLCATQDSGELCLRAEVVSEFQQKVEIKTAKQPCACTTELLPPDCSTDRLLAADSLAPQVSQRRLQSSPVGGMLASQVLGDPKHQNSCKRQSKMLAHTYKDEVGRRPSPGNHKDRTEESCTLDQVREREATPESQSSQHPPEKRQALSESFFQRSLGRFLQWISPKKQIKGWGDLPKKGRPAATAAQSQRQISHRSCVDPNVAEAQELLRAVGQMLEKKMTLHRERGASQLNEQTGSPVSGLSCCHQPTCCSEQTRILGYAATPKGHRDRQIRGQRFNNEQPVPRASGHRHHCPRHCPYRAGVFSGQPGHFSPVFFSRKTCFQEKI